MGIILHLFVVHDRGCICPVRTCLVSIVDCFSVVVDKVPARSQGHRFKLTVQSRGTISLKDSTVNRWSCVRGRVDLWYVKEPYLSMACVPHQKHLVNMYKRKESISYPFMNSKYDKRRSKIEIGYWDFCIVWTYIVVAEGIHISQTQLVHFSTEPANAVCNVLEAIFLHGLKPSVSIKKVYQLILFVMVKLLLVYETCHCYHGYWTRG